MKKIIFSILLVVGMLISGCTTSKSVVSQNVDLSKYKYALVLNNDTYRLPVQLMEYEIQLYDAIEQSRLQLIGDMALTQLTPEQQAQLLLVKYGVDSRQEETVVTVNFIDFNTGRPIASCRGAYSTLGFNNSADITGAIKRAAQQIALTFGSH